MKKKLTVALKCVVCGKSPERSKMSFVGDVKFGLEVDPQTYTVYICDDCKMEVVRSGKVRKIKYAENR